MATLTIRNLPDDVRDRLRVRAARNGRSMEAEAREALKQLYKPERADPAAISKRMRAAQELVRQFVPPGVSLTDSLIADRRWEAACDAAEAQGLQKPPRSDFD
jgi:plasmid stability protein